MRRYEAYYRESIRQVWLALTDPQKVRRWLTSADFKPLRGHRFPWKEASEESHWLNGAMCEIEEVDEPRRLTYRLEHAEHGTSVVTWKLESVGEGTRVIIEQELRPASVVTGPQGCSSSWIQEAA